MSKERLIKLLRGFEFKCPKDCLSVNYKDCNECRLEQFADYLIANGVIVPPCKVGQTLYFLYDGTFANRPDFTPRIYETNDWYFDIDEKGISILPRSIRSYKGKHHYYLGKTVFPTREEAEKVLEDKK